MAGWSEILAEIDFAPDVLDVTRKRYLEKLANYTDHNVVAYYSSFLTKRANNIDINDTDMNGFMNAFRDMDYSKGLDLILHTPGGSPEAAESIVNYIKSKFGNNFRIIVPQLAMSAGTMIACAGKEIVMGNHSSLGPIDPQFNGIPAYNIVEEFKEAEVELRKNPENIHYWAIKLRQYPAAFLKSALDAIALSNELAYNWLSSNMFVDCEEKDKILKIVQSLNEHANTKTHGRHLNIQNCRNIGLKVLQLEQDQDFQDCVLSVHHIFMISIDRTNAAKIIESHSGRLSVTVENIRR